MVLKFEKNPKSNLGLELDLELKMMNWFLVKIGLRIGDETHYKTCVIQFLVLHFLKYQNIKFYVWI